MARKTFGLGERNDPSSISASSAGLHYVSDAMPGISRRKSGADFIYFDDSGKQIQSAAELARIKALAIPPAYKSVWICPDPNGHLQATGVDARGRKQYRYHTHYREVRDENKFQRLAAFGKVLPKMRSRVDRDLALVGLPREKVLAVVVYLLERSLIRVGNDEYAKSNKSFGLTTMLSRHVRVEGAQISFSFLGKSKIRHHIEIHDRRLARLVKRIQDLPGQNLFHYVDEDGQVHGVDSSDVNGYLHEISGGHFTAKDFRTWWGTLLALVEFSGLDTPESKPSGMKMVRQVMGVVAKQLGNTPTVCRRSYVHPRIVEAFLLGSLPKLKGWESVDDFEGELELVEKRLVAFLSAK